MAWPASTSPFVTRWTSTCRPAFWSVAWASAALWPATEGIVTALASSPPKSRKPATARAASSTMPDTTQGQRRRRLPGGSSGGGGAIRVGPVAGSITRVSAVAGAAAGMTLVVLPEPSSAVRASERARLNSPAVR
jgi:hypothetical protein